MKIQSPSLDLKIGNVLCAMGDNPALHSIPVWTDPLLPWVRSHHIS